MGGGAAPVRFTDTLKDIYIQAFYLLSHGVTMMVAEPEISSMTINLFPHFSSSMRGSLDWPSTCTLTGSGYVLPDIKSSRRFSPLPLTDSVYFLESWSKFSPKNSAVSWRVYGGNPLSAIYSESLPAHSGIEVWTLLSNHVGILPARSIWTTYVTAMPSGTRWNFHPEHIKFARTQPGTGGTLSSSTDMISKYTRSSPESLMDAPQMSRGLVCHHHHYHHRSIPTADILV